MPHLFFQKFKTMSIVKKIKKGCSIYSFYIYIRLDYLRLKEIWVVRLFRLDLAQKKKLQLFWWFRIRLSGPRPNRMQRDLDVGAIDNIIIKNLANDCSGLWWTNLARCGRIWPPLPRSGRGSARSNSTSPNVADKGQNNCHLSFFFIYIWAI